MDKIKNANTRKIMLAVLRNNTVFAAVKSSEILNVTYYYLYIS